MSSADVHEEFVLEDGEGIIDVRGDGFDSGLVVEGDPVVLTWNDCEGSIGQYLVRSKDTRGLSDRLRALRHVAGGGLDPGAPLAPQIRPLLALFASGVYRLRYTPALSGYDLLAYDARSPSWEGYYPLPPVLVPTQRSDTLNPERVRYFRKAIAGGVRPVVFTAGVEDAYSHFVLDGHHKLQAYNALRSPPAVLWIEKLRPDPLPLAEGLEFFGEDRRPRDEYRRVKRLYGGIVTESDWLKCDRAWDLLRYEHRRASDRKRRLFACACCRQRWHRTTQRLREAVEVAERFADGLAGAGELAAAFRSADAARGRPAEVRRQVAAACQEAPGYSSPSSKEAIAADIRLAHDVFGNPFRPVVLSPSWRTPQVIAVAKAMYEDRAFADIPLLADALEEAGCDNPEILSHCRGPGPHVRGCWALDGVLGRH